MYETDEDDDEEGDDINHDDNHVHASLASQSGFNRHDASSASPTVMMIVVTTHLLHLQSALTALLKRIRSR